MLGSFLKPGILQEGSFCFSRSIETDWKDGGRSELVVSALGKLVLDVVT